MTDGPQAERKPHVQADSHSRSRRFRRRVELAPRVRASRHRRVRRFRSGDAPPGSGERRGISRSGPRPDRRARPARGPLLQRLRDHGRRRVGQGRRARVRGRIRARRGRVDRRPAGTLSVARDGQLPPAAAIAGWGCRAVGRPTALRQHLLRRRARRRCEVHGTRTAPAAGIGVRGAGRRGCLAREAVLGRVRHRGPANLPPAPPLLVRARRLDGDGDRRRLPLRDAVEPGRRRRRHSRGCSGVLGVPGRVMPPVSRGFQGRRNQDVEAGRLPPGNYLTPDFPVLSAGPTPHDAIEHWSFQIRGEVDEPRSWTWEEFTALPRERVTVDIHCVTKWSKLDTSWTGVSLDTLLGNIETSAAYVLAFCDGGYTTNLPLDDVREGKAWGAYENDGKPPRPEHGGPARLLVPHLYFWKSAKWLRGIDVMQSDRPGFWEGLGYHNR